MSNVVTMPGSDIFDDKPNESLIAALRALLADAESGLLRSFVGTGFQSDEVRITIVQDDDLNPFEVIGALSVLSAEYTHARLYDGELDA